MRSIVTKLLLLLLCCAPVFGMGQQQQIPEDKVKNLVTDLAAKASINGVQQEGYVYAADTGTANAYAVTLSPAPTIVAGSTVTFKAANANTGASTLAVNGGAATAIKKQVSTALASGDILAGQIVTVKYDGTNWQLIGSSGSSSAPSGSANQVYATPNGSSGSASLRSLVAADLPLATSAAVGAVKPDNSTITVSGGVMSAVPGGSSYAPIQILQKNSGSGNAFSVAFPNANLVGSTLVVCVTGFAGSPTLTDTQGNTYTSYAAAGSSAIFVAVNVKGGANTENVNGSGGFGGNATIYELSNVAQVEASTAGATGSSVSTLATGSASSVYPFEFVLMTAFTTAGTLSNANSWPSGASASSIFGNTQDFYTTVATPGSVSNTANSTGSGTMYTGFVILRPIMSVPNPMTTIGDLIVGGTNGVEQRLAAGASGKVLTGNGASTQPSWQDPAFKSLTTTGTAGAATLSGGVLNIPNYSGGGGSLVLITETVTAGSQASVTFSSIANSYRDLLVIVRGRGDTAATSVPVLMQLNGDTGANYDYIAENRFGTGSGNAATSMRLGDLTAATAPSSYPSGFTIEIFDYRGTTFFKACSSRDPLLTAQNTAGMFSDTNGGWWRSTAAVTDVKVFLSAGNFVNGSVVSLYGRL